jgi:phosphoribosylamine--glycine ligase
MKILIIDAGGVCLDFALRCKAYGHQVKAFIRHNKDGSRSEVGDGGLIERVTEWEKYMNWADLVFCTDNTFYIHGLERYRDKGYPIIGPSIDTNRWEQDREHGRQVMEKAGIKTIPSVKFSKYDDAIKYVMENPKRYVSKPIGDGDKALSYVAKSAADMVYMLQYWKKKNSYKGEFILQDFHPGIEMAVGGWFGPGGFNKNWCENWEFKKLMNNDLGVATGEQGTILRYTPESCLADKVLKPLEDYLHGLAFTGYIDVNCIIGKDGTPWPLEFTMRPGWPLFQIQQAVHKGDPAEWMLDLLNGKDTQRVSTDVACGVVISIPDYPYSRLTKKECSGYPLFGITEEDVVKNIHLSEVQWGKAPCMVDGEVKLNTPMFVTAGDYVCTVTGTGSTVEAARDKCYGNIKKKIEIPNSIMYRTDIGKRLEDQLPELYDMGYCQDLDYE